jgi:N-acetylmuramic acid 6-phosphate etherase
LRRRAAVIVRQIAGCQEEDAVRYLEQADGDLKTAILLGLGLSGSEAAQMLKRHGGNLRAAIEDSKRGKR